MGHVTGCLLPEPELPVHADPTRRKNRFLKGPIPLEWLQRAGGLPGDTLKAGVLVWHAAGLARSQAGLTLPPRLWQGWYRDRSTLYRALERLEAAGLVVVDRRRGRSPTVCIVTETEDNHGC